ncbi:MAG: phosphoribosylglycinamide formyltransferase [Ignavibacteriales bacterium]|nr:phosphoribosylglycinamide formyltransferase [Ignavibacteriales bacterium]
MLNIAVFVSGRGSNLRAIIENENLKDLVKVVLVISDKIDCGAFKIAEEFKIETAVVGKNGISFSELIIILDNKKTGLIVLAGFLKLIPAEFVKHYEERIINIHPALLPSYGGKGMYGHHVHEAVFQSGDKFSGPTVHFVNSEYDRGAIIAQKYVDISEVKSADEIASLVLKAEHILLPEVVGLFAQDRIKIENGKVKIVGLEERQS